MTISKTHLPLALWMFLSASTLVGQQSDRRESSIEITQDRRTCEQGTWCLTVEVRGIEVLAPSSTRLLPGALVSVAGCSSAAADANGRVALSCTHSDPAEVLVRQIGFLPAQTVASVASGGSYLATAILAPAGMDPVIDTFYFPCEEWDAVDDRIRCFDALLHDVRGRLLTELDSTRALLDNPTLLDSAQAAWDEFVDWQCSLQASLPDDEDSPAVRERSCRHWLTEARIGDIRQLRWRAQWREPSNSG